jgi:hypothetical protein
MVATHTQFLYHDLQNSMARAAAAALYRRRRTTVDREYSPSGWYSIEAICHWLYEHTVDAVTLTCVMDIMPNHQYCKASILSRAPPGCKGLLILYRHHYANNTEDSCMHYKAWVERHGLWIECESMAYAAHKKVKITSDEDWH